MLAFSATSLAMLHVESCCQSSALPTELLGHFKQKQKFVSTRITFPPCFSAVFCATDACASQGLYLTEQNAKVLFFTAQF
jgi:hypothetical protein